MSRFLEIQLIGDADDVEEFVKALRSANILGSDSVNYPTKHGKVQRYLDVVMPGTNSSSSLTPITIKPTDGN